MQISIQDNIIMNNNHIIIAGGGIGGLTCALSLHRAGLKVTVYESARELKPLGVGINILPDAVEILSKFDLYKSLKQNSVQLQELIYANKFGQQIWKQNRGRYAGLNSSQLSINRGVLQMLLLKQVIKQIGEQSVFTGFRLKAVKNNEDGKTITATFEDRLNSEKQLKVVADGLIGADGVNSAVRRQMYPNEGQPKFRKIMMYRGVSKVKPFLGGNKMIIGGGTYFRKIVIYPIQSSLDSDGNQLINWVAQKDINESHNEDTKINWHLKADKKQVLEEFKIFKFDQIDIQNMIEKTQFIYKFPMIDRDPLPTWTNNRITLLGDAAHPMYPIGSNGANQAIIDSNCLGQQLKNKKDIPSAFKLYQQKRLDATSKIVILNRQLGPQKLMQVVDNRAPNGFKDIRQVLTQQQIMQFSLWHFKNSKIPIEAAQNVKKIL